MRNPPKSDTKVEFLGNYYERVSPQQFEKPLTSEHEEQQESNKEQGAALGRPATQVYLNV
jgi:hypothetical protein